MMRTMAAAACLSLLASNLLANSATADEWSGLYFGGAMSAGRLKSSLDYLGEYKSLWASRERTFEVINGPNGPIYKENSLTIQNVDDVIAIGAHASDWGDIGPAAGLVLGGNFRFGSIVAGAEINVDWADFTNVYKVHMQGTYTRTHTVSSSANGGPLLPIWNDQTSSTQKADAELSANLDWKTGVIGRLGLLVTEGTLVYGLVGYARAGFSDAPFDTRDGLTLGVGLEASLANGWFLRTEYRRTEFERWEVSTSNKQVDASDWYTEEISSTSQSKFSASTDEVRAALVYKFKGF